MPASPAPSSVPDDPLLGRVLAGTYRLEQRLGGGAMGTVYRAQHTLLAEPYAVKVLHPDLAQDEDVRRRFLQEARALTRFTHKNAVAVRHCGEEDGLVFLAMDLCHGRTLEALLAAEGPALDEARVLRLAIHILAALGEAHAAGIVHRDLKPANVMVEPAPDGERARVLDFGLSRLLAEHKDVQASRISALGEVVGTVAYMSPEQALGEELDGRSDLFSLGVLLYELVEGRHPFDGGPDGPRTMASLITRILEVNRVLAAPTTPRRASEGLQRVLARSLQRDRALRHPDAAALAADLEALLEGRLPASAARAVLPPPARSRRGVLALAAGAGLAALAGAAVLRGLPGASGPVDAAAEAEAALAEGRYDAALRLLEPLARREPPEPEHLLALAEALVSVGDPEADRALAAAQRALPGDARVDVLWGRYQHRVKADPEQALRAFAQALGKDRGSAGARRARLDLLLDPAHAGWLDARPERRLALAAADVEGLARSAASPADEALARSELRIAQAVDDPAAAARLLLEADEAAAQASRAEPAWGAGPAQRAEALLTRGGSERAAGRAEAARRLCSEAVRELLEARRRVEQHPRHRAQGGRTVMLLKRSLSACVPASAFEQLAADARLLARLAPKDLGALSEQALALRTAGQFEEALPLYEALSDAAPSEGVLADLAFCHQRIALGLLLSGEHQEGVAELRRALRAYDAGLALAPRSWGLRAYRGETWALLARYAPAEASAALSAAADDLEQALKGVQVPSNRREVLHRRAGLRLQTGDPEGARADLAEAVGREPALNAAFHGRYARALLALAVRALLAGDATVAHARRDEALAQAELARERSGPSTGSALLIATQGRLLGTVDAAQEEARAAAQRLLADALQPGAFESEDGRTEARLWQALLNLAARPGGAAAGPLEAALRLRREEAGGPGGDVPSRAFFEAAAGLLDAASGAPPGLADAVRALARRAPP